jgi:DNA-binding MarR family transcriptional regulator
MVSDLSRQGVLERREDESDRRRRIISVTEGMRQPIEDWLAGGAAAWVRALEPLTPEQRRVFVDTLLAYEEAVTGG